ncbi:MAG: hypothetical protein JJT75_09605 [Opitutales bacterium]|nr:hypothetical protein [Opitutales bacterium]MCH8539869.1 hypothetical protein [Opitutales bacterium]
MTTRTRHQQTHEPVISRADGIAQAQALQEGGGTVGSKSQGQDGEGEAMSLLLMGTGGDGEKWWE